MDYKKQKLKYQKWDRSLEMYIKWRLTNKHVMLDQPAAQAYPHQYMGYKAREGPRKWISGVTEACQKYGLGIREAAILPYERKLTTTLHSISRMSCPVIHLSKLSFNICLQSKNVMLLL